MPRNEAIPGRKVKTIRLDGELLARVEPVARANRRTVPLQVEQMIEDWFDEHEDDPTVLDV